MQVIIHTNDNGGVSVTVPTGELPINDVLVKDCPAGALIIDDSKLPKDNEFFNAWELVDGEVTVNFEKAQGVKLAAVNAVVLAEAQKRQLNTLSGIDNDVSDEDFIADARAKRAAIAAATTLEELKAI
jgi:hypothetical protein